MTNQSLQDVSALLSEVDAVVDSCVVIGNPESACHFGIGLQQGMALRGVALAKLLYGLSIHWDKFKSAGVDEDYMAYFEANMGVRPITATKYITMWKNIFASETLEEAVKQQLLGRPVGELLLLTASAADDSLSHEQWLDVVAAPNKETIRDIVKRARGDMTSSQSAIRLSIVGWDSKETNYPGGAILATRSGITVVIGYLVPDTGDTPEHREVIERARSRIISSCNMTEL